MTRPEPRPAELSIVRGRPTDAEVAALSVALMALTGAVAEQPHQRKSPDRQGWMSRHRQLRVPPVPGPGAWRGSVRG